MININIKNARKNTKISQRELGRRIGKTGQYISYLEKNKDSNPSLDTLKDISEALGIKVSDLLGTNYFIEKVFNLIPNEEIDPECEELSKQTSLNSEHLIKLRLGQFMYDDNELKETESTFIELLKYCCLRFTDELYHIYQGLKEGIYTLPTTFSKDNIVSLLDEYYSRNLKDKEEKINSQYETFFELCKKHCDFDISFTDNQFNVSNTKLGLNYPISEEDFTEMFKDIRGYIFKELFYQSYKKFINKKEGD